MRMPCWLVVAAALAVGGCSGSPEEPQQPVGASGTKVVYEIRPPMS